MYLVLYLVHVIKKKNICLFLAVLGLRCYAGIFLAAATGGCSLVAVCGFLTAVAFLAEHRLNSCGA